VKKAAGLPPTLELYFTNRCNLACRYCSTGELKRGGEKTLSLEEILRGVELAGRRARALGGEPLTVGLTGGEPLLEFDLLRRAVTAIRRRWPRLGLHVCTNGTLLDREKAEFLLDRGVELDISLDGWRLTHDANRRFGSDPCRSVFSLVEANLRRLPAALRCRLRAVATFDSRTIGAAADSYKFLLGLGFRSFGFGLDIYERWPARRLPALAAALRRFRAAWLAEYRRSLRAGLPAPPFPFENKLGGEQAALVSNEFSLSVDCWFFPSDTVCRGPGPAGCAIGDLRRGIDPRLLRRAFGRLSRLISGFGYPNGILPAADRYYHALFRGEDPRPALREGAAVSAVFERELGGLLYARALEEALLRDKDFGDFAHGPRHAAVKPAAAFAAEGTAAPGALRKALDHALYAGRGPLRLELSGGRPLGPAFYALAKAARLGRRARMVLVD